MEQDMTHPSFEEIYSYSESRLDEIRAREVEGHLAICDKCHGLFTALGVVERVLPGQGCAEQGERCAEDWEIAAVLAEECSEERSKRVKEHTSGCRWCMERAAEYFKAEGEAKDFVKTPAKWVASAANALRGADVKVTQKSSTISRACNRMMEFSERLPTLVGYAAVAAALALLLYFALPPLPGVVTVPSSEVISYREPGVPASFAFMAGAEVAAAEGMVIVRGWTVLEFDWDHIKEGGEFDFIIREKGGGVVYTEKVSAPQISVPLGLFSRGEIYEWLIKGETGDNTEFNYQGEFLVAEWQW